MKGTIYKITNTLNGKVYIGKTTKDPDKYWRDHIVRANRGVKKYLYSAMRKYGINNFEFEIIDTITEKNVDLLNESIFDLEEKYIHEYNSLVPKGYNMTKGGEGLKGLTFSKDHKKRISDSLTGRVFSVEHRQHLREYRLTQPPPMLGKNFSIKHRQRLRESKLNVYDGEKNPFYGKTHTKENCKIISDKLKKYYSIDKHREHSVKSQLTRIPLLMICPKTNTVIKEFDSLRMARRWIMENTKYKGDIKNLAEALRKSRLAYGYKWEYR